VLDFIDLDIRTPLNALKRADIRIWWHTYRPRRTVAKKVITSFFTRIFSLTLV
jgi:hypothetical protein